MFRDLNKLFKDNNRGFTLVEVIVAMVILSIVLGASYSFINSSVRIVNKSTNDIFMRNDLKAILLLMTKDIQESVAVTESEPYAFTQPNNQLVVYQHDNDSRQILRIVNGRKTILMDKVESFRLQAESESQYRVFKATITIDGEEKVMIITRRTIGDIVGNGALTGQVISNSDANPIVGASVVAYRMGVEYWSISGDGGQYLIDLPEGIYKITTQASGYQKKTIDNISVTSGLENELDISMDRVSDHGIITFRFLAANNDTMFIDISGEIDEGKEPKEIAVIVPWGTDITSLVPTITYSDNATLEPLTGESQDFSGHITYILTTEYGGEIEYVIKVMVGHPPGAPSGEAYTYIDGIEKIYTLAELENQGSISTDGILYIPASYGDINLIRREPVIYKAKEGIFIGANIYTKAADADINLVACNGVIEIDDASFETGTGQTNIYMKAGRYISAKGSTMEARDITLEANYEINVSAAKLNSSTGNGIIILSVSKDGHIIDINTDSNKTIIKNNNASVSCP